MTMNMIPEEHPMMQFVLRFLMIYHLSDPEERSVKAQAFASRLVEREQNLVKEEREACARMCDEWGQGDFETDIPAAELERKYGDHPTLSAYIRSRRSDPNP
jgi:hypothetical protein